MKTVLKVLTALAAVIGAAYVIATYGDKIVAWAKQLLAKLPCRCKVDLEVDFENEADAENAAEEAAEPAVEEVPVDEEVEEVVIEAHEPVAEEADFA